MFTNINNALRNQISSAVAIVTLEITGVPVEDLTRQFPWPKPEFIAKPSTRSSTTTFDVSIFESGDANFLFPLSLYLWRVQQLEAAIFRNNNSILGIKVMDVYFDSSKEDATFTPYECTIVTMLSEDDDHDEVHFQGCGYNSIGVEFIKNDFSTCSPWDINIFCPDVALPLPSCLTKTQKETMFSILDTIEKDTYASKTFSAPVDTRIYVDYLLMIENPIHISNIRERLQLRYYTNVYSLRSDVKLIVENCNKYNKPDTSVSMEAESMYEIFVSLFEEKLGDLDLTPGVRDSLLDSTDDNYNDNNKNDKDESNSYSKRNMETIVSTSATIKRNTTKRKKQNNSFVAIPSSSSSSLHQQNITKNKRQRRDDAQLSKGSELVVSNKNYTYNTNNVMGTATTNKVLIKTNESKKNDTKKGVANSTSAPILTFSKNNNPNRCHEQQQQQQQQLNLKLPQHLTLPPSPSVLSNATNSMQFRFDQSCKCDVCDQSDGYNEIMNMQKCHACGIYVHEACYGIKYRDFLPQEANCMKYKDWKCFACSCKICIREVFFFTPSIDHYIGLI